MPGPFTTASLMLSPIYLLFLAAFTRVAIWHDSIGYEQLAGFIATGHWVDYFSPHIHREPLYPMFIAPAMWIGKILDVPYISVVLIMQVFCLLGVQCLMVVIMSRLKIRDAWQAVVILYTALSPSIVNFTLVLWSDFLPAGFILAGILLYASCWKALRTDTPGLGHLVVRGVGLGLLLAALTLLKAVFELAGLLIIASFIIAFLGGIPAGRQGRAAALILAALMAFQIPINAYKGINQHFNGHYAITDRGSWALYGSTMRRLQPMTGEKWLAAALVVPHTDFCTMLMPKEPCLYWGSDPLANTYGFTKTQELYAQMPQAQADKTMVALSLEEMRRHPFQMAVLGFFEGCKLMFWEYFTPTAYAVYPPLARALYSNTGLMLFLRTLLSILTVAGVIWALMNVCRRPSAQAQGARLRDDRWLLLFSMAVWVACYILPYSFFYMFGRYALALAPVYLIWIAGMFNALSHRPERSEGPLKE